MIARVESVHSPPSPAPGPVLQRKCACGGTPGPTGECAECRRQRLALQRRPSGPGGVTLAPPIVHRALRSPAVPLDPGTRGLMESRFGHDFGRVRVHTGELAAASASAVGAEAYTVGRDLVFAAGRYAPRTPDGRQLLAHELAHTVQQRAAPAPAGPLPVDAGAGPEREAERAAAGAAAGPLAPAPAAVARFSVRGHHVIEEAALEGSGFTAEQIEAIHKGNVQRDFSQVGAAGNAILRCDASDYGGYAAEEHFDNYVWDAVSEGWKSRGKGKLSKTPIDYIESELRTLTVMGLSSASLVHLGNAFHTVEDFFAHSNFVELINGDERFGNKLVTGSVSSGDTAVSVGHTLEPISDPRTAGEFHHRAEEAKKKTEPLSHSNIAKDDPGSPYHQEARRLAALVIQKLALDIRPILTHPDLDERKAMMKGVFASIRRFLRPPDTGDPWWSELTESGGATIDKRLTRAAKRTPETEGQCVLSPLANIEASKDSPMKIPIGVAQPISLGAAHLWLQAGVGVHGPSPLDTALSDVTGLRDQPSGAFAGAQLTGTFDLNDLVD